MSQRPEPRNRTKSSRSRPRHNTNKGRRFPADPIRVDDVFKLLNACSPLRPGREAELSALRLRGIIVVLYRTGMRINEALALEQSDLDRDEMTIHVRRARGGKARIVAMDEWGWRQLDGWLVARSELPPGAVFCVIRGQTAGQAITGPDVRRQLKAAQQRAGLNRRANPQAFRHGFSVELWQEGVDLYTLQKQLGHARLDVTAKYLRGIDPVEVLQPISRRRPPMIEVPTPRGRG